MEDLKEEHYTWLKEKYGYLVKIILGSDYCSNSIRVFDADIEAFTDMKKEIDTLKYDLKMWRRIAIVMIIISVLLVIFK